MKALVDVVFRCGCFMGLVVLYCYFEVRGVEWLFPGCVVEGRHAFFGTAAALAVLDGARVWWTGSCLLAVFGLQRYRSSLSGEVSSPAAAELASLQQTRLDSLEFFAFVAFAIGYALGPRRRKVDAGGAPLSTPRRQEPTRTWKVTWETSTPTPPSPGLRAVASATTGAA